MTFTQIIEVVGAVVEGLGVAVTAAGVLIALGYAGLRAARRKHAGDVYRDLRRQMARSILLGLELLVAGDIIRTVAVDPTLQSVAVLAAIVVVRTFLSMTIELEVSGRWPWQRAELEEQREV